jgi:hypothetical protein
MTHIGLLYQGLAFAIVSGSRVVVLWASGGEIDQRASLEAWNMMKRASF